jgi:transposase
MFCVAIADIPYRGPFFFIREGIMGKSHVFVQLTRKQAASLKAFLKKPPGERARRRAQAIWFSSQGQPVREIAKLLSVSERSVRSWLAAWRKEGLDGLRDKAIPGRSPSLSPEQAAEMVEVTRQSPASVGLDGHTWNCRLLSEWVDDTFHVRLSDEWVRQLMLRHGMRFRRPKLVLTSPDPDYARKKGRLTG